MSTINLMQLARKRALLPATRTYRDRVEADGGEIHSLSAVNNAFRELSAMGITSGLVVADRFGRKVVSGRTSKLYNLFESALDAEQTTEANRPKALGYSGEKYVWLPGVSDNYISTPDSVAISLTTDVEIEAHIGEIGSSTFFRYLVTKWAVVANERSYALAINGSSHLVLLISGSGSTANILSSGAEIPPGHNHLKAHYINDTGGGQYEAKIFTSQDGVTWIQLGSTLTGVSIGIFDSGQPLVIGATGENTGHAQCAIYSAIIRDGIDGTVVASFDASQSGQNGYTDATLGTVWTINRSASGMKAALGDRPLSLYGTDRYMEVADNALLDFGVSDAFSVAAGLRVHADQPTSLTGIVTKRNSAGTSAGDVGWILRMGQDTPVSVVEGGGNVLFLGGTSASHGSVRLIGMTRGGGVLGSSTNGTVTTTTDSTGDLSNTHSVRFGRLAGTNTNYVDMELLGGAILRQVLTSAQLTTIRTLLGADE